MGGSSKVVIRGVKSLSGNNQPLFVIDGVPIEGTDYNTTDAARGAGGYDYGNLIQDINPDDIASISVLKGPNASALYGSRASNGVVMITTKKGTKNKGLGISVNSSLGFEKVNKLPKMQKEYGGGYELTETTIAGKTYLVPDYGIDESWGPRYDSSIQHLSWYNLPFGKQEEKLVLLQPLHGLLPKMTLTISLNLDTVSPIIYHSPSHLILPLSVHPTPI